MNPHKDWTTEQDVDEAKIEEIAQLLRRNPFVPPDPEDPTAQRDWEDVQSGVALPRAHCAFKGCSWVNDAKDYWEDNLKRHVKSDHREAMKLSDKDEDDFFTAGYEPLKDNMLPRLSSISKS